MLKRVLIPDSHGSYIDKPAAQAFLKDLKRLAPDEVVFLGDHVDASGIFSKFKAQYLREHEYTYRGDIDAGKAFVHSVRRAAPNARMFYLEGNHEWHIERWIASTFDRSTGAMAMQAFDPAVLLGLESQKITYIRRSDQYGKMSTRGVLKLEACYFVHGISAALHATSIHLNAFGDNVAHGHTHRAVMLTRRRPNGDLITGQCPGTLAGLSPLYMHTNVNAWSHGYGLQFVDRGRLFAFNIPIIDGKTVIP